MQGLPRRLRTEALASRPASAFYFPSAFVNFISGS